jgi:O-antigen ligase
VCFTPNRPRVVDWYMSLLIIIVLFSFAEPVLLSEQSGGWMLYVTACVGLRRCAMTARTLRHSNQHSCPLAGRDFVGVSPSLTGVSAAVRSVQ